MGSTPRRVLKTDWIDPYKYAGIEQDNSEIKNESSKGDNSENDEARNGENNMDKHLSSLTNYLKKMTFWKQICVCVLVTLAILVLVGYTYDNDCRISSEEMKLRLKNLQRNLHNGVYGQHIAVESIFNAIQYHVMDPKPGKPLVLSFHGGVGTGKTFISEIIAENLFKGGLKNRNVKSYLGPKHFYTDPNKVGQMKNQLGAVVESLVSTCSRSLFIFDEADKMVPGILDGVAPFLGYNSNIDGVDYSKSIFIFLTNTGASLIDDIVSEHFRKDKNRHALGILDFRQKIQEGSFNDKGGLSKSNMILQRNVNHYVPFLPLQRQHIVACIRTYLAHKGIFYEDEEAIAKRKIYYPDDMPIFAEEGCKNIDSLVDPFINKYKKIFQDEL